MLTAIRLTAKGLLKRHHFVKMILEDKTVWKIVGTAGSKSGGSKTSGGGWKAIGRNTVEMCACDESEDDSINFFM